MIVTNARYTGGLVLPSYLRVRIGLAQEIIHHIPRPENASCLEVLGVLLQSRS